MSEFEARADEFAQFLETIRAIDPARRYEALPDEVKTLTDWHMNEIMRATYLPLLGPIREFIERLSLSPGDEIISLAIRDASGDIRVVSLDD